MRARVKMYVLKYSYFFTGRFMLQYTADVHIIAVNSSTKNIFLFILQFLFLYVKV